MKNEPLRTWQWIVIVIIIVTLVVVGIYAFGDTLVLPNCVRNDNYYWSSWSGNRYDTGTADPDLARKIAGDKPISKPHFCEYR